MFVIKLALLLEGALSRQIIFKRELLVPIGKMILKCLFHIVARTSQVLNNKRSLFVGVTQYVCAGQLSADLDIHCFRGQAKWTLQTCKRHFCSPFSIPRTWNS